MANLRYNAKVYEDTAENFASDSKVYGPNDLLFASDTGELKRGNGTDAYADLPGIGGGSEGPTDVAWADVTGKPTTFPPAAHAATLVNVAADATNGITAGNAQVVLVALAARVKALEDAAV